MMKPFLEGRENPAKYPMISSFELERFRCFKHAKIDDLRLINVVVGDNASGKTSLGEAFYIAAAAAPSAAWFIRFSRNRLMPQQAVFWDRRFFQAFWQDLFFNFDDSEAIEVSFHDSERGNYKIKVFYDQQTPVPMPVTTNLASPVPPLVFERTDSLNRKTRLVARVSDKGQPEYEGIPELIPPVTIVTAAQADIVNWYSILSKGGHIEPCVQALKELFPQIKDISIELDATLPSLFVQVAHVPVRMPLTVASAGIAKVFAFFLAIASARKGIVLVDEMENGLHYSRLEPIWTALRDFCIDCETQFFAITHSRECLQAMLPAMTRHEDYFSLIRTEVSADSHRISHFQGDEVKAALEMNGGVRLGGDIARRRASGKRRF